MGTSSKRGVYMMETFICVCVKVAKCLSYRECVRQGKEALKVKTQMINVKAEKEMVLWYIHCKPDDSYSECNCLSVFTLTTVYPYIVC